LDRTESKGLKDGHHNVFNISVLVQIE
jgi:hypothetical protein